MIALYKIGQTLEHKIEEWLQSKGFQVSHFYSVKSLITQMMNPMVIVTPHSHMKELESLRVPVIPLTIPLMEIVKATEHVSEPVIFISSVEELEWLDCENQLNLQMPVRFINREEFLATGVQEDQRYFAPVWDKEFYGSRIKQGDIHYLKPSDLAMMSVLRLAGSLVRFSGEVVRERFQLEAIVNSAHDGVIAVDREGSITVVNQHAKTILGLKEDVKGRKITDFIPQSDMMRVLQTGKIETGDIATVADRQIVINRFPVIVKDHVVGAVSNIKVITDIQKLELKLRKMLVQNGLEAKYALRDIVGQSPEILEAKEMAGRFATAEAGVLITGESGTGKELFAQGIHQASHRSAGPFLAVNCAALPGSLLESELFGYEEGAFTGARKGGKAGLFELAHGGTLFLDEIGEMPPHIQSLLLRVLQEKSVRRIGGERIIPVDVRIIAATNRDLEDEMDAGLFRSDLYFRLNVLTLELPPLRERLTDISLLIAYFVQLFNESRHTKILQIEPELVDLFKNYHWPGNIRELRNIIERMMVLEQGETLSVQGAAFFAHKIGRKMRKAEPSTFTIKDHEKEIIGAALQKFANNKTLAAKSLGLDRSTLWRKIKEYHL